MKIRKFKHKKTGHIFEQDGSYYNRPKHELIPAWLVEDSNDWEEIIEKDYEILSLIGNINNKNYENVVIKCEGPNKREHNTHWNIHSVKRLSDGEIFTIGDKITGKSQYNCIINSIELNPNYPQIMFNKLDEGIDLINAKHIKQPLFTTEDGVDIFVWDKVYYITKGTYTIDNCIWKSNSVKWAQNIHFSTKEKAQEYVDLYKPKYSLNDVLSVAKDYYVMPQSFIDKLKKLNK